MQHYFARLARVCQRNKRLTVTVFGCCLALLLVVLVCVFLMPSRSGAQPQMQTGPEDLTAAAPTEVPVAMAEPSPTAAPAVEKDAEARIAEVVATMGSNCTKDAPQITDPATWNEAGKALIDRLCADPYYVDYDINVAGRDGFDYLLAVNRAASTVTVYTLDESNRYTVPFAAFVCSGGSDTPLGYFTTPVNYQWRLLSGPCYGQYATRIWDAYLFHSVPYYTQHKDDLEYDQFNLLGTPASLGCIRLAVADVKWIFDNCPIGTPVIIYDDAETPGPMGKPGTIATDPADETLRGWDPTDPDPANPWDDAYLTGTAIRSSAAWQQWNDAVADGRWTDSINPADLRGFSTDSKLEGTRG